MSKDDKESFKGTALFVTLLTPVQLPGSSIFIPLP